MSFLVIRQQQKPDGTMTPARLATGRTFATNGTSDNPDTDAAAWIGARGREDVKLTAVEVPT